MKRIALFAGLTLILGLTAGCEKDSTEPNQDEYGRLDFKIRTWDTYSGKTGQTSGSQSNDTIFLDFVDVLGSKYALKVTTDDIYEGLNDNEINWITIYESSELKRDGERDFSFTLPAGEYKGFAVLQSNEFSWLTDLNDTLITIPASNEANSDTSYNVFGPEGLYTVEPDGVLSRIPNNEMIGVVFTITDEKTTLVTIRTNIMGVLWHDADQNRAWSDGDQVADFILPPGVKTMSDFIVEYK